MSCVESTPAAKTRDYHCLVVIITAGISNHLTACNVAATCCRSARYFKGQQVNGRLDNGFTDVNIKNASLKKGKPKCKVALFSNQHTKKICISRDKQE